MDEDHPFAEFQEDEPEEEFDENNHELVELFERTTPEDYVEFINEGDYE